MDEIDMDKKIIVCKLPADGRLRAIAEEIPDNLTQLQHYVDGYIEIVTLSKPVDGRRLVMIVNDCGLIWGLPVNPIATQVYQFCTHAETPICGNAIVCAADDEGELQDINPFTGIHLMMIAEEMQKPYTDTDK
jgi:hypothetical protein